MLKRVDSDRTLKKRKRFPLQILRMMSCRNLGSPDDIGREPLKNYTKGPTSQKLGKDFDSEGFWKYNTYQSTVPT